MDYLRTYQRASLRTSPTGRTVDMRIAVAGLGLSGEAAEVLVVLHEENPSSDALIKELGDVMWYVAEAASTCGIDLGTVELGPSLYPPAVGLVIECGNLTDYFKKVYAHGHALDTARVFTHLGRILYHAEKLAVEAGSSLETVCEKNVAKLMARYQQGFRVEDSINRKD